MTTLQQAIEKLKENGFYSAVKEIEHLLHEERKERDQYAREVAIGFDEWKSKNEIYEAYKNGYWWPEKNTSFTREQLFDEYIKTLKQ